MTQKFHNFRVGERLGQISHFKNLDVIRFKDGSEEFGLVSRQCDVTDPSGEPVIKCDIFSDERRTECNKVNKIERPSFILNAKTLKHL